ncbi:MAG: WYL domain-containing protein [Clostridiales bacterium]|nr:WYL domain-containing protein [Clostridiales bacterium]
MANSDYAKVKLLLIYDYFMKNVIDYDQDSYVTVSDLNDYLFEMIGERFERKSLYADIKRINEYMVMTGMVEPGREFIYKVSGKKYSRSELKGELSLDEARLIVDAVSTMPFVKTGLCEKIKKEHPIYFKNGYISLHGREEKTGRQVIYLLNMIRGCIEEKMVFSFGYGYMFAGGIKGASVRKVSPLELDWQKDRYYLIAIDNEVYERTGSIEKSLRHYRVDRIDRNYQCLPEEQFIDPGSRRKEILDQFIRNSVDAYSTDSTSLVTIRLTAPDEKTMLRAYAAFSDAVGDLKIIRDKSSKGMVEFCFDSGVTPTLCNHIFMLYTFDDVTVEILTPEVREVFEKYLKRALGG